MYNPDTTQLFSSCKESIPVSRLYFEWKHIWQHVEWCSLNPVVRGASRLGLRCFSLLNRPITVCLQSFSPLACYSIRCVALALSAGIKGSISWIYGGMQHQSEFKEQGSSSEIVHRLTATELCFCFLHSSTHSLFLFLYIYLHIFPLILLIVSCLHATDSNNGRQESMRFRTVSQKRKKSHYKVECHKYCLNALTLLF